MEKNFDDWNIVKKKIEFKSRAPTKRGEIYWIRFGVNIGVEQDGKDIEFQRPGVILKKFSNEIVLVAPLTTKIHKGDWYLDLSFKDKNVQIILNQIKPLDTKRLISSMGQISDKEVDRIINEYSKLILN